MKRLTHRIAVVAIAPILVALAACVSGVQRGVQSGDTQIVAQWLDDGSQSAWLVGALIFATDSRITEMCGSICHLDGNDVGSGTWNLYVYAQPAAVSETVQKLIDMEKSGHLPAHMRIGVAKYKNSQRTDWTYEPVYPTGLTQFDLSYRTTRTDRAQ